MPEAGGKTLRRRLRIVPVALDDRAAVDPDFADLAARQFVAVGIDGDDLRARTGQSDAVDMPRGQFAGHHGRRRRGLGGAVAIRQLQARNLGGQPFDRRNRHRRAAKAADPPARQIVAVEIRLQQAEIIHRRHHHGVGDALARRELQIFRGLELRHDDQRAGATNHGHDVGDHAGDMPERHRGDRAIRRGQLQARHEHHRRMDDVAMREHRALRLARGARRVEDHRGVFFADLGRRRRGGMIQQSGELRGGCCRRRKSDA